LLPLLDGMVPAFAAMQTTAAKPVRRFGAFYLPNGMSMASWTPTGDGSAFRSPRSWSRSRRIGTAWSS
jgi:hypothetical protein